MNRLQLERLIQEEIRKVLAENRGRQPSESDVSDFVTRVLRLGSRDNIFDKYMSKKGIDPYELSTFMRMVIDDIKTHYLSESTRLQEAEVVPIGPDGQKITDTNVIRNLNMALKSVSTTIRPKLIALIEDPGAVKELKNIAQKTAVLGAMAVAFGITEREFSSIVSKIKKVLPKEGSTNDQA